MSAKPVSRRKFLKAAGITLAASAFTCSGVGYVATRAPQTETPEFSFGEENTMTKRILVTYATRAGSTVDVATAIGKTLAARGFAVDVKPIKENPAVGEYQAVVIGSAVRVGRWVSEAVKFVTANQQALNAMPVAVFCVHGNNLEDDEPSQAARSAYLDNIRALIQPVDEAFFAGSVDPKRVSLLERVMINAVKSPVGDFRDWEKIQAWAQKIFS